MTIYVIRHIIFIHLLDNIIFHTVCLLIDFNVQRSLGKMKIVQFETICRTSVKLETYSGVHKSWPKKYIPCIIYNIFMKRSYLFKKQIILHIKKTLSYLELEGQGCG